MNTVALNAGQRLYVIVFDSGVSCLGFDNARDHANQIATLIGRHELAFTASDHGAIAGYAKYQQATKAWGDSALARRTYFDPGTAPEVARVLESCRKAGNKVRLVLGDAMTGESWLDEHDVVGTIGRSCGSFKVPLLVEEGEHGGGAILTARVLCISDWRSGKTRYRHPAYREPDLGIKPTEDAAHRWAVVHHDKEVARFADIGKAGAYLAFMRGETVGPQIFR
ncbi:MAG: hypothetical protein KGK18_09745 [Burkholderiales bacterium]|nr:hypothetical protein [Burkholderiales bacterium]